MLGFLAILFMWIDIIWWSFCWHTPSTCMINQASLTLRININKNYLLVMLSRLIEYTNIHCALTHWVWVNRLGHPSCSLFLLRNKLVSNRLSYRNKTQQCSIFIWVEEFRFLWVSNKVRILKLNDLHLNPLFIFLWRFLYFASSLSNIDMKSTFYILMAFVNVKSLIPSNQPSLFLSSYLYDKSTE